MSCNHCNDSGKCNCDSCWKWNGLNPNYRAPWYSTRSEVPCKECCNESVRDKKKPCPHCHDENKCNCDACWDAEGLNCEYQAPWYSVRDKVPCKICKSQQSKNKDESEYDKHLTHFFRMHS